MIVSVNKCKNISHKFPILAWAIMVFQRMNPFSKKSWSHMAIHYNGRYFDVTGDGCKEYTEVEFKKNYKIIETHYLSGNLSVESFYEWFDIFRHREYDYLQLTGLTLKVLGFLSFNFIGHDSRKMICSELILNHLKCFYSFEFIDSDNFDLLMTWEAAKKY